MSRAQERAAPKSCAPFALCHVGALQTRSVCLFWVVFYGVLVSSAVLHVVENTFRCAFESYLRSHSFQQLTDSPDKTSPHFTAFGPERVNELAHGTEDDSPFLRH